VEGNGVSEEVRQFIKEFEEEANEWLLHEGWESLYQHFTFMEIFNSFECVKKHREEKDND
jgi:hypothetical protein